MSWFGSSGPTQQQLQQMQLEAMRKKAILDKRLVGAENVHIVTDAVSDELTTAATIPIPQNLSPQQYMQIAQKLQAVLSRVTDTIATSGNNMQKKRLEQGSLNGRPPSSYPPQYGPRYGGRKKNHKSKKSKSRKQKKTRRHR
jgi:hypothetical protein